MFTRSERIKKTIICLKEIDEIIDNPPYFLYWKVFYCISMFFITMKSILSKTCFNVNIRYLPNMVGSCPFSTINLDNLFVNFLGDQPTI